MIYMLKSFISLISKLTLCSILIIFFASCTLFHSTTIKSVDHEQDQLQIANQLVEEKNFNKAISQIENFLIQDPSRKTNYLLLLARSYDQTAQPEKALLSLKELSSNSTLSAEQNILYLSLLLKNQAKAGIHPNINPEKTKLQHFVQDKLHEEIHSEILNSLNPSLEFQCDLYCVQEVQYFQEIQTVLVLLLEKQEKNSHKIMNIIQLKYKNFLQSANSNHREVNYKKSVLAQLSESYKALSRLQIITPTPSSLKTAKLIQSLKYLDKEIEQEMYK